MPLLCPKCGEDIGVALASSSARWRFFKACVGWLVGLGIQKGSEGRGGRGCQLLALVLAFSQNW
ncbi:MAG TPA: hypothetical protein DIT01_12885 [Lentisphaeria bacterium]|nr:hypothetical protein [Lentisphaeria bacterium]|tara:strand:+ start:3483 stop:3674 length:192 start_codon:yes stop_codon:yes gene_type:complete